MKQNEAVCQHPAPVTMADRTPALIDRREAVRRAALLLAGVLSASTIGAVLTAANARRDRHHGAARRLDATQRDLVATIADHIIPATDTPGARAAGVPAFIETMLLECYTPDEQRHFADGLAEVDARARRAYHTVFLRCASAEQRVILEALDREAFAEQPVHGAASPFFRTMKDLTILGYYSSELGATKELRYARVPGRYEGCIPLANVGRAWAV